MFIVQKINIKNALEKKASVKEECRMKMIVRLQELLDSNYPAKGSL
jgi:hypothetical protein